MNPSLARVAPNLILAIGYGNELRRDDGIGPWVARRLADQNWPGVQALAVHQLTPELAEFLACATLAIFVDAGPGDPAASVEIDLLRVNPGAALYTHFSEPTALLTLTLGLFGRAPQAYLVQVAGAEFGLGEQLSQHGQTNAAQAIEIISKLIEETRTKLNYDPGHPSENG